MTEEKDESPYQVYYNMYCEECDDDKCLVKRKELAIKKVNNSKSGTLIGKSVRDTVLKCAKLRDLVRNYYKD